MSTSIYKIPYKCDCGMHYGSCGADNAIILVAHYTVDTYSWLHTDSHEDVIVSAGLPKHFGLNAKHAIEKIFKSCNSLDHLNNPLTDLEREAIKNRYTL